MKNIKNNLKLFILAAGIISIWRGVWGLLDIYLFPGNQTLSLCLSIIIGVFILYFQDHKLNELVSVK